MPRHSPNALTSRLRVHTTNDKPEPAASRVDDCFHSQPVLINALIVMIQIGGEPLFKINRTSAASIEKPIHNVKVPMGKVETLPKSARRRKLLSSYLDTTGGAYRDRTDDPLLAKQVLSQLS